MKLEVATSFRRRGTGQRASL